MRTILATLACIAIAHGAAEAARPANVVLSVSDIRHEARGDRLADINVALPSMLDVRRLDFAILELWIEPAPGPTDSIPLQISIVPVELDGGGVATTVEGRWADALVAQPWLPKRIVLDSTRLIRYWLSNPESSRIISLRFAGHVPSTPPTISNQRLGSNVVARLRIYSTARRGVPLADHDQ